MRAQVQTGEESMPIGPLAAGNRLGRVLVVEDSMLIALDAEDALLACGVGEVVIAGNVATALARLDEARPDFAVLDYNLGEETSEAVAIALDRAGVPYCFATGYGDALDRAEKRPPYGVLTKPYSHGEIAEMVERAKAERTAD